MREKQLQTITFIYTKLLHEKTAGTIYTVAMDCELQE